VVKTGREGLIKTRECDQMAGGWGTFKGGEQEVVEEEED